MVPQLRSCAIHTLSPLLQVTHEDGKCPSIDKHIDNTGALNGSHHCENLPNFQGDNAQTRLRVHCNKRGLESKALHNVSTIVRLSP